MGFLDLQPGDVINDHVVKRTLGRGGMGAVYLVHHARLGADVALKLMTVKAHTEEELETARARFAREARTLIKLRHPAIVRVLDYSELIDEDGVTPYILMEHFDGVEGGKWIRTNPSLERIRHVALQVADALSVAHAAGVLHRDLKASNMLVNKRDEALLLDFGIAKGSGDENMTQTGFSVGTMTHMAPECLQLSMETGHSEYTERTDLWSFGCMLYFFTTHRNAFSGGGQGLLMRAIIHEPHIDVRVHRADVSPEWAALINDLLQKDPTKRIGSATELKTRLAALASLVDPTKPAFVPPLPPTGQRTPTPGQQTTAQPQVQAPEPVPQVQASTMQARPKTQAASAAEDPFDAVRASPLQDTPPPGEFLPPVDGITGVQTAQHAPRGAVSPAPLVAAPASAGAPLAMSAPVPVSVSGFSPAAVVLASAEPLPLAVPAVAVAPAADDMGTFIRSLRGGAAPAQSVASPKPLDEPVEPVVPEDSTPSTSPVRVVSSFPIPSADPAGLSVVGPLPSFAPPPPKATQRKSALRSLFLPIGAVGAIVVVGLVGSSLLNKAPTAAELARPTPAAQAQDVAMKKAEERAQKELASLERDREAAARASAIVQPLPVAPVAQAAMAAPAQTTAQALAQLPSGERHRGSAVTAAPAAAPTVIDPVAAKYGNRAGFNTSAVGQAAPAAGASAPQASAPIAGVKIPVRVDAEIASTPSPVIAIVTKETKVGPLTLPVGTQIHGQSSGGQGTRVTIAFRFAIVGGKNVPLLGSALAQDGRAGIPGARTMGNGTDVAASALGSATASVGNIAAGVAGDNPLGDAIRGASGAASSKTERLNSDENLVVVKRGARFSVYVGG